MTGAYYNEIDPYAAAWLRNLIAAGHIAPGDVDERDIRLVQPAELAGYTQCHFFAGIGVWSYALRLAWWPDDRAVWTGSCPCQPFSPAGARKGHEDERHLWPAWFRLIGESRPLVCFGEQVADGDGEAWFDDVGADLEGIGYAVGAVSAAACGFGAPHERQRLFFVADAERRAPERHGLEVGAASRTDQGEGHQRQWLRNEPRDGGEPCELAHSEEVGFGQGREDDARRTERVGAKRSRFRPADNGRSRLGNPGSARSPKQFGRRVEPEGSPTAGFWRACDWLPCRDGKARPVEPGTFPLAHGAPARVGRLRAYGNAIVAPVAAEFVRAYMITASTGDTRLE